MNRSSFKAIALAQCLTTVLLAGTVVCAAAAPDPAALKALGAAQARLLQREQLFEQTQRATLEARRLEASVQSTRRAWEASRQSGAAARDAVAAATDCQAQVPAALEAQAQALDALLATQAQSIQAVQAVAAAQGPALQTAAQLSDTTFQSRTTAELAGVDRQGALRSLLQRCSAATRQADARLDRAFEQQQALSRNAAELPVRQQALSSQWAEAAAGHRAAARAGWISEPPDELKLPELERARAITHTFTAALSPAPTRSARVDDTPLRQLQQPQTQPLPAAQALARLLDAAAYLDLVSGPTACPDPATCEALQGERSNLAPRITQAQDRLSATRTAASAANWDMASLAGPLHADLLAHRSALNTAEVGLPSVLNESAAASESAGKALRGLQAQAAAALEQAETEWEAAWRQAHASEPPRRGRSATARPSVEPLSGQSEAMSMGADIDLRSHAYELFEAWDTESKGFGAYTYVLMRSASDLNNADARRRFSRLLEALQKLPEARLVDPTQARNVNLFCIPGSRATDGGALPVVYASDLGQQLKLRAQNGLLTRKEVSQRLLASPGPFLITLPGRMANIASSAPLLFADLSGYPDDAIADLATHYMNGLVDEFPSQQRLWKPPVLQRVALVMIHLATGTGDMMSTLMPSAQAAPR